jgi:hypothetical protein
MRTVTSGAAGPEVAPAGVAPDAASNDSFLLKRVQPALSGLMDGSLSTLAPIFAVVLATHRPLTAFSPAPRPPWARE